MGLRVHTSTDNSIGLGLTSLGLVLLAATPKKMELSPLAAEIQIVVWKSSWPLRAMTAVKVYIPWHCQLTRDLVPSQ